MLSDNRRRGAKLGLSNVDYRVIDAERIDFGDYAGAAECLAEDVGRLVRKREFRTRAEALDAAG